MLTPREREEKREALRRLAYRLEFEGAPTPEEIEDAKAAEFDPE